MHANSALTPREFEILNSIVEAYIENGEPVASRSISRRRQGALSAASIRNVMADLSEEGYLDQPHTSAGRVPTAKAFRLYVQSLIAGRLPAVNLDRLREDLNGVDGVAAKVGRSSHFLVEVTRNVGIAAAIPASSQTLDQIELLRISPCRVLMIVVTRDHTVRNRVVTLSEDIGQDELISIRNYVNQNFSGWVLSEARCELERRLLLERAAYDEILKRLMLFNGMGLFEIDVAPEVYMEGASNLVGLDLHLTREKMRELFRALEEKKRILQLLEHFLEQPGELSVYVGLSEAHPSMGELSLIGMNVTLPNGVAAKIAVLGPMRMNYGRAMSAVLNVGQTFQTLPS